MLPIITHSLILPGCDAQVTSGIEAFNAACTSAYTNRSRRYSIWKLVHKYIEPCFADFFRKHGLSYPECVGYAGVAEALKQNADEVERRLRFHIRMSRDESFRATLETVLYLSYFCRSRIPFRSVRRNTIAKDVPKQVRRDFDGLHYPYCELCWRLCQHALLHEASPEGAQASIRFCADHNPGRSSSRYRTDHNSREEFHSKLKEIYRELPDKHEKWMRLAGGLDETSIRRYAYRYAHSVSIDDRLAVLHLASVGHTNSQIAARLDITRQMVHKLLNHRLKKAYGRTEDGLIYTTDQLDAFADEAKNVEPSTHDARRAILRRMKTNS